MSNVAYNVILTITRPSHMRRTCVIIVVLILYPLIVIMNHELIGKMYYNPSRGLMSAAKLIRKLQRTRPEITQAALQDYLNTSPTHQIHSKIKTGGREYQNRTIAFGIGELQIDLLDLGVYSSKNNGYKYVLMVCDIYSRKLFTKALRSKTATETLRAMKLIENEMKPVMIRSIIADRGLEFNNKYFKEHFKGVNIFYKDPELFNSALAIVDRYCRTIRDIMQRYFTAYGTTKWYTRLQDFTDNINDTINSTTKHTPNEIWYGREINEQDLTDETIKLSVGDLVRN